MLLTAAACGQAGAPPVTPQWTLDPVHPAVGEPTEIRLTLGDRTTGLLIDARLQLEAQMSHPGMATIVAPMTQSSPGVYEAVVKLSMRGDWVLVATGETPDGRRIREDLNVPDVGGR